MLRFRSRSFRSLALTAAALVVPAAAVFADAAPSVGGGPTTADYGTAAASMFNSITPLIGTIMPLGMAFVGICLGLNFVKKQMKSWGKG